MSDDLDMTGEELDLLAAEYALGLLDDGSAPGPRTCYRSIPISGARVARWSGRLAPLLEEVEAASPPPGVWTRIESAIGPGRLEAPAPAEPASNVHVLRRRVNVWRGYSAIATALAASLALFLVTRPPAEAPSAPPTPAPLVAMMEAEGSPTKLVATYDPASRMLLVTPAAGVSASPGHAHELWLIPADGKPRSMGVVEPGGARRMAIPPAMLGGAEGRGHPGPVGRAGRGFPFGATHGSGGRRRKARSSLTISRIREAADAVSSRDWVQGHRS